MSSTDPLWDLGSRLLNLIRTYFNLNELISPETSDIFERFTLFCLAGKLSEWVCHTIILPRSLKKFPLAILECFNYCSHKESFYLYHTFGQK